MKQWILWVLLLVLLLTCAGCGKYTPSKFLGKTSGQIEAEFGAFDCIGKPADNDGIYRNCSCGYTLRESRAGFLQAQQEIIYFITFDENGVAVHCEEGYRPGG